MLDPNHAVKVGADEPGTIEPRCLQLNFSEIHAREIETIEPPAGEIDDVSGSSRGSAAATSSGSCPPVNSSDLRSRKRVMSSAAANCGGALNSTTANVNAGRRRR